MTCPRAGCGALMPSFDREGESYCWRCGYCAYMTPPLTYDEAAALPRRGTSYDAPLPSVRPKPSTGVMADSGFTRSMR